MRTVRIRGYGDKEAGAHFFPNRRGNQLDVAGWAAVADALMGITSCTSLNGCDQFAAMREGGLRVMTLEREWELGSCAWKFVERSSSTLTKLDVRCASQTDRQTDGRTDGQRRRRRLRRGE